MSRSERRSQLATVLYYTLASGWRVGGSGWRVMAVTTEKSRQVYGRYVPENEGTHREVRSVRGRFPTAGAARAALCEISTVAEHYAQERRAMDRERMALHERERQATDAVLARHEGGR